MKQLIPTQNPPEKSVLVALIHKDQPLEKAREYLDELHFLSETLELIVKEKFFQRLEKPDVKTFVGKGKLEDIHLYIKNNDIQIIIFDDELSPSQLRNLENHLKIKIYDRTLLILDIFLRRAKTSQARTQVELARYQYLLPRLTHMWTHLERQRGGTGSRGGAGEKEIETDRRSIKTKIDVLTKQLEKIKQQGVIRRKDRETFVRISLVGYTNVGKSTIMNFFTKANVLAENKLFATVDSTVRKVFIDGHYFLLSDTVGFIRKLPTKLIEAFQSTLDEIRESDILLHIVDLSHPHFEEQIKVVEDTLQEINAGNKTIITVFNKSDKIQQTHIENDNVSYFERAHAFFSNRKNSPYIFISAYTKDNTNNLKKLIVQEILKINKPQQ